MSHKNMAIAYAMKKKAKRMAEGGMLTKDGYQSECTEHCEVPCAIHEEASGFVDHEGDDVKHDHMAMEEDDRMLNQHGDDETGPTGSRMAKGGFIGSEQSDAHEDDMVGRVMKKRQKMYSEGGKVANDDHPFEYEFEEPDQFDVLAKEDDLKSSYTGANSGDELGNKRLDEDDEDIVSRVMRSRSKKDRNPRPA